MTHIKPMDVYEVDKPELQAIKDACPSCGTRMTEVSSGGWRSCRQCRAMWKDDTSTGFTDARY